MAKRKYQSGGAVEDEGYIELEGGPMTDDEHNDINQEALRQGRRAIETNNSQRIIDSTGEMLRVSRRRQAERERQPDRRERERNIGTHRYGNGGAVRGTKWGKIT
jgi:hypothetical protein